MSLKMPATWSTPVRAEPSLHVPCAICQGTHFTPFLDCMGFAYVKCASCGLVQINPQPCIEAVHSRYDKSYLEYELKNEDNFAGLGRLALQDAGLEEIEMRAESAGESAGKKRALEIGCATGAILDFLRGRGWEVQGVEISRPQAAYAREKRALDVSTLPLEQNNFEEGRFFLIIASHLIEHLNEPASFLRSVHRLLAPGGAFLITTPNVDGLQARLFGARWRSAIFDHLYLFSKKTLSRLLKDSGFTIESFVSWGGIAKGFAPAPIKAIMDKAAKAFKFGDVMLFRCTKR